MFTASHVWALAVAAQRINGEYLKEDEWFAHATPPCRGRDANKRLVRQWLREGSNPTTAADIAEGEQVRSYFNGFLLREISGKINDFERTALKIAQKDEFSPKDMYEFSVIACLPSVAVRDKLRQEVRREVYYSEPIKGNPGDQITGDIMVISCSYSQNYNKWMIQARMGESFINFWFKEELRGELRIKAKIKQQRGDKTTQMNFVKVIG